MTERERVIKAFEFCLMPPSREEIENDICSHEDCPYYREYNGGKCMSAAVSYALALLEAKAPRVMTLEEYDAWINIPFTERDPVFHEERTKRGSITCWVNTTVCSLREYGKNDRCWTSRPTDEQMEAIPWND